MITNSMYSHCGLIHLHNVLLQQDKSLAHQSLSSGPSDKYHRICDHRVSAQDYAVGFCTGDI